MYKLERVSAVRKSISTAAVIAAVAAVFYVGCVVYDEGNPAGPDNNRPGTTFTDSRDGKSYKKVTIGAQTWMAENLNYNASGSKCYDNSDDNCAEYGRLYDWSAAMGGASSSNAVPSGVQGVCPAGWHLPGYAEWTTLRNYLDSATAGRKLKSTTGWVGNGNGTDDYGFSALPGGYANRSGIFRDIGSDGFWWSTTERSADSAFDARLTGDRTDMIRVIDLKTLLFSVRCLQDYTAYTVTFNANGGSGTIPGAQTVIAGSSITIPGQGGLEREGYEFGGWNVSSSGTGANYSAGSSYTPAGSITLYAKWNEEMTLVDSRDRQSYKTVKIGSQIWMAENLNYDVPNVTTDVCYDNSAANCDMYGRLYDWSTATAACPTGWHLPNDAEWAALVNTVGGSTNAGARLRASGTDEYGFSALPGGCGYSGSSFENINRHSYWWSATEDGSNAVYWHIYDFSNSFSGASNLKTFRVSVRCLQN